MKQTTHAERNRYTKRTAAKRGTSTTANTAMPKLSAIEQLELCAMKNATTLKEAIEQRTDTPEEANERNRIICECLDTFAAMRETFGKPQGTAHADALAGLSGPDFVDAENYVTLLASKLGEGATLGQAAALLRKRIGSGRAASKSVNITINF